MPSSGIVSFTLLTFFILLFLEYFRNIWFAMMLFKQDENEKMNSNIE